jgi:hypothetical protein
MSDRLEAVFHGVICGLTLWLAVLWVVARCTTTRPGRTFKAGLGIATGLGLFVPIAGAPVLSWAFSFCPNPSVPMLGMIFAALWQHIRGVTVFKPADWRALWIFGAVAGTALYLHPWIFSAIDLYYWGWHETVAVGAIATLAVGLLAWGNRLGVLFLGALIVYELEALESHNCWDYVIDPFYWLISLGLGGAEIFRWWQDRHGVACVVPALGEIQKPPG